ncbi:hypothetical protein BXU01_10275 [[Flexibacter] sp. ATCC 35103]|nr:hypothetical protein BXU01_10275 [[Flexibacter] sp. ATCC 35103]
MLILLIAMTFGFAISCSESSDSNCPTKTCEDFKNQPDAQAAFDSNRSCYKNLDGDGNGRACESLPKK